MPASAKPGFHIPSLDGIRALAFSIVYLAHSGLDGLIPGGLGVTIFFFLSGYLITTLLRKEYAQTGTIHLGQFYARRVLRIFPPFYITLAIVIIGCLAGYLPGMIGAGSIAAQAAFLTNYYQIFAPWRPEWPAGTDVFWSLAVEEHFYLLFPFLAIPLLRRATPRGQAAILGGACLVFLAWRCFLVFFWGEGEGRIYGASDTRIDSILFGCILALWHNPVIDAAGWPGRRAKPAIYVGSLGLLLFCLVFRAPWFRETFRYTLQGIALFPLFHFAIADSQRPWFRWLNWRWVRFVGLLSYSLYLIHFSALMLIRHLEPGLGPVGQSLLAIVISLAYALTLHHAVERPLARYRKRLHTDPNPPSAEPED
jgi:peptidoglycan/LPS O-acetylase OafA/YrhL